MGPAGPGLRSLWLALLDDEGQLQPVIVPIDDVPMDPGELVLGLREVLDGVRNFADPVLLLSRPGPWEMTDSDRRWGCALVPLTRWPVHLYTPAGVRVFAPDDLATGPVD